MGYTKTKRITFHLNADWFHAEVVGTSVNLTSYHRVADIANLTKETYRHGIFSRKLLWTKQVVKKLLGVSSHAQKQGKSVQKEGRKKGREGEKGGREGGKKNECMHTPPHSQTHL